MPSNSKKNVYKTVKLPASKLSGADMALLMQMVEQIDKGPTKKRVAKKKIPTTTCKTCGYKKTPATSMMCHLCNSQL